MPKRRRSEVTKTSVVEPTEELTSPKAVGIDAVEVGVRSVSLSSDVTCATPNAKRRKTVAKTSVLGLLTMPFNLFSRESATEPLLSQSEQSPECGSKRVASDSHNDASIGECVSDTSLVSVTTVESSAETSDTVQPSEHCPPETVTQTPDASSKKNPAIGTFKSNSPSISPMAGWIVDSRNCDENEKSPVISNSTALSTDSVTVVNLIQTQTQTTASLLLPMAGSLSPMAGGSMECTPVPTTIAEEYVYDCDTVCRIRTPAHVQMRSSKLPRSSLKRSGTRPRLRGAHIKWGSVKVHKFEQRSGALSGGVPDAGGVSLHLGRPIGAAMEHPIAEFDALRQSEGRRQTDRYFPLTDRKRRDRVRAFEPKDLERAKLRVEKKAMDEIVNSRESGHGCKCRMVTKMTKAEMMQQLQRRGILVEASNGALVHKSQLQETEKKQTTTAGGSDTKKKTTTKAVVAKKTKKKKATAASKSKKKKSGPKTKLLRRDLIELLQQSNEQLFGDSDACCMDPQWCVCLQHGIQCQIDGSGLNCRCGRSEVTTTCKNALGSNVRQPKTRADGGLSQPSIQIADYLQTAAAGGVLPPTQLKAPSPRKPLAAVSSAWNEHYASENDDDLISCERKIDFDELLPPVTVEVDTI